MLSIAILISKTYFITEKKKKKLNHYVPTSSTKIYLINAAMVTLSSGNKMVLIRIKYPPLPKGDLLKLGMLSIQTSWKCNHFRKQLLIFLEAFKQ